MDEKSLRRIRVDSPARLHAMNDYERIAEAIRFLDREKGRQPCLADVAAHVGLSEAHFHRLFHQWAGVTPKNLLQCLTLSDARSRLSEGNTILDTALDAGLSGPGRLHDLCVKLEAATPGEIKSGGADLTIVWGMADSPFGSCMIAESPRGICHLSFPDASSDPLADLRSDWSNATLVRDAARARAMAYDIFAGDVSSPLHVRGTPFQLRIWRALIQVAPGRLTSYSRLAAAAGNPNASRATGSAVGANPISYLIPCHRVIRETGLCGNYRWDPVRKRAMLARELA